MRRAAAVVFCLSLLFSGCGGGGDSAHNPNIDKGDSTDGLEGESSTAYTGKTTLANVDSQSAHDIVFHTTTISDLTNALMFGDEQQRLRFDALSSNYTNTITGECRTGILTFSQTIDNIADFSYDQCTTGPFTISGSGTMTTTQFTTSGDAEKATLTFENLSVTNSLTNLTYLIGGDIQLNISDVEEIATFNTVIKEASTNNQYLLQDYQVAFSYEDENQGYSLLGKLYIANYGYVDVETLHKSYIYSKFQQVSPLLIMIKGSNVLLVNTVSATELNVTLNLTGGQSENPQQITVAYDYYVTRDFEHTTNLLPTMSFILASEELEKNQTIIFDASASIDQDDDFIAFNWSVSKQPSDAKVSLNGNGSAYLDFSTDTAGDYEITLDGNDGISSGNIVKLAFRVNQDPPQISINAPDQINYGQAFSAKISAINKPDEEEFNYELYFGPTGMTLSQNNEIVWNGAPPRLGENLQVNYAVKVSNQDHEVISRHSVQVNDTLRQPAIYLNAHPIDSRFLVWADVNQDNFTDVVVLRGGDVEAWDLSQPKATKLWQIGLGDNSVKSISYIANMNALAIVPGTASSKNAGMYQFDISSQTLSQINTSSVAVHNESIVTDLMGDDELEFVSNFSVFDYQTGEVLLTTDQGNHPASAIGDFNGDGQKDIAWGLTIFSGGDLSLIADISNDVPGVQAFSVAFYDFDNDGQDEFICTIGHYDHETQKRYQNLYVYQFEDGQAVEKIKLLTIEGRGMDFLINDEGVIFAKGENNQIYRFTLSENLNLTHSSTMNITTSEQSSPCQLKAVDGAKLFLSCYLEDETLQTSTSFISQVNWGEELVSLPVTLNMDGDGYYGNMYEQKQYISVSAYYGVYLFDDIKNVSFLSRENHTAAAAELGYYPQIDNHTIQDGQVLFWNQKSDSKIQILDLQSNIVDEIPTEIFSNKYSNQMTTLDISEGYMLSDNQKTLHFINQSTLEIDYIFDGAPSHDSNSIYAVKSFVSDDIEYVAVWKEQKLLLFKYEDNFNFITALTLPDSFDGHHNTYLMEHVINYGQDALVLIQDYKHKVVIDLNTLTLNTQVLAINNAVSLSSHQDKSCVTRLKQTDSKNAYITSFSLAVEESDWSGNLRQPKLVEYDLINDEIIWASEKLSGKFHNVYSVLCGEIEGRQSLSFSSTYQVISTN